MTISYYTASLYYMKCKTHKTNSRMVVKEASFRTVANPYVVMHP